MSDPFAGFTVVSIPAGTMPDAPDPRAARERLSYGQERNLRALAALTPEEQAVADAERGTASDLHQLDTALASAAPGLPRQTLLRERAQLLAENGGVKPDPAPRADDGGVQPASYQEPDFAGFKVVSMPRGARAATQDLSPEAIHKANGGSERTWAQLTGDMALKVGQGVVDLGEAAVGLGDIASFGTVGKALAKIGYDPDRARAMLEGMSSEKQQTLDRVVSQAGHDQNKGFMDNAADVLTAIAKNPAYIPGAVAESLPSMLAAGGGARALAGRIYAQAAARAVAAGAGEVEAAAAGKAAVEASTNGLKWATAAGEGAQSAGQIAEQARQQDVAWKDYVLPAIAAGVGTASIGRAAGAIPGFGEAETAAFTGSGAASATGNRLVRTAKGIVQEGLLEEMPQSAQEQMFGNIATGKPAGEGVAAAAVQGAVTGAAMGGGMGAVSRAHTEAVRAAGADALDKATDIDTAIAGATAAATPAPVIPPPAAPAAAPKAPEVSEFDQRVAAAKEHISTPGFLASVAKDDPETKDELLHALAIARNPRMNEALRNAAMDALEQRLIEMAAARYTPNFTMPPNVPGTALTVPAATGVGPAANPNVAGSIPGEFSRVTEALPAPPQQARIAGDKTGAIVVDKQGRARPAYVGETAVPALPAPNDALIAGERGVGTAAQHQNADAEARLAAIAQDQANIDNGLTPDVRRAQDVRNGPKTVAGQPVEQHTDEALAGIARDLGVAPATRHAATAALAARAPSAEAQASASTPDIAQELHDARRQVVEKALSDLDGPAMLRAADQAANTAAGALGATATEEARAGAKLEVYRSALVGRGAAGTGENANGGGEIANSRPANVNSPSEEAIATGGGESGEKPAPPARTPILPTAHRGKLLREKTIGDLRILAKTAAKQNMRDAARAEIDRRQVDMLAADQPALAEYERNLQGITEVADPAEVMRELGFTETEIKEASDAHPKTAERPATPEGRPQEHVRAGAPDRRNENNGAPPRAESRQRAVDTDAPVGEPAERFTGTYTKQPGLSDFNARAAARRLNRERPELDWRAREAPHLGAGLYEVAGYRAAPIVKLSARVDPESQGRRRFIGAIAAAAIATNATAGDDAALGKAKAIAAGVLDKKVDPAVEKILRGKGGTHIDGASVLKKALQEIGRTGPAPLRALANQIAELLPEKGLLLTVDDTRRVNAHGATELSPIPHLILFTAEDRTGLTYGTIFHESLHTVVAARYRDLSSGLIRSNDRVLKMSAPAASQAMEQFKTVWREFQSAAALEKPADQELALSLREAVDDPDEFFVRSLTDPLLQKWMAGKEYKGKSLLERFKDWVKYSLFGLSKSGTAPSWLDAALIASGDLNSAMGRDAANFERLRASNDADRRGPTAVHSAQPARPEPRRADTIPTPSQRQAIVDVRGEVSEAYGEKGIANLEDAGILKIVTDAELPQAIQDSPGYSGNEVGWHHDGVVYLVADNLDVGQAPSILMHELGEHYGLEDMLGSEVYARIQTQVKTLAKAGNAVVKAAWGHVATQYPELKVGSPEFMSEVIARVGEDPRAEKMTWWRQLIDAVRAWLVKQGFTSIKNDADIKTLLRASLARVMRGAEPGPVPYGEPALAAREDGQAALADRIDAILQGKRSDQPLYLGQTPPVLQRLGMSALPMGTPERTIEKAIYQHGMLSRELKTLADAIADPVAVVKSESNIAPEDALVVVTDLVKSDGRPVIVAMHANKVLNRVEINQVASVYPRERPVQTIPRWFSDLLLYANKEKRPEFEKSTGVRFPGKFPKQSDGRKVLMATDFVKEDLRANWGDDPFQTEKPRAPKAAKRGGVADAFETLRDEAKQNGGLNTLRGLFDSDKTFNLWHRTIGTQFHKAQVDKDFGRVFDAVNQQVTDTSRYAIESEAEAPNILQRLGSIKDVAKAFFQGTGKHAADMRAMSQALFANIEGESGVKQKVFTDAELKDKFKLTPRQIELYREARTAIDASLDRLGQTLAMKTGSAFVNTADLKNQSLDDTVSEITGMLDLQLEHARDAAGEFAAGKTDRREAVRSLQVGPDGTLKQDFAVPETDDKIGEALQAQVQALEDAKAKITQMRDYTHELQKSGYSPAMRFGRFAVSMGDPKNPSFFSMYETQVEANHAAMALKRDNPGQPITKSIMNPEQWKMFAGVSPETVALFAKFMGADQTEAFKQYVALAASTRSAMKRMLERKGTAGFSWDASRVLAQFITSNARQSAMNVNSGGINEALHAIPREKGDVAHEAQKLVDYIRNPKEEAAALRGLLFMHFMGGSLASAAVNLTQPVLMTAPYLSQFVNPAKLSSIMTGAARIAAGGKIADAGLRAAMQRANDEGITQPHEIHQLMAEAGGSAFGKSLRGRAFAKAWGGFFSVSEAFNRKLTFAAAFDTARAAGMENPFEFAAKAVIETQGLYGKQNRPNWARGAVGATLFTFKQFSIAYLEFVKRLPVKQQVLALAVLMMAAGLEGLPFAEDIEDLIDTVGQRMGYATNSRKALRKAVTELLGDGLAEFALHGISGVSGMPLDLSARMGMGNLIPASNLFNPSEKEKGKQVLELAGAVGGLAKQAMDFGDSGKASDVLPSALKAAAKGLEMFDTGEYRDTKGRLVRKVDTLDAASKFIGFQPANVARDNRRIGEEMRDVAIAKRVESEIAEQMAEARIERDVNAQAAARKRLKDWNADNPDMPIKINDSQITARVKAARLTRDQRFAKTVSPEMRRQIIQDAQ